MLFEEGHSYKMGGIVVHSFMPPLQQHFGEFFGRAVLQEPRTPVPVIIELPAKKLNILPEEGGETTAKTHPANPSLRQKM